MEVWDFNGTHTVHDSSELEEIMQTRSDEGLNEFCLSHEGSDHPLLLISVKGDLAAIHYFPRDGHAGFASIGGGLGLGPRGMTSFATGSPVNAIEITNDAVIPFSTALAVAKEFLRSRELPRSIKWLEL